MQDCVCGQASTIIVDSQFPIELCNDCYEMLKDGLSLRVKIFSEKEEKL